eukprot:GHVU01094843.1.p1 GENE.GHVU01094843.1~~GHVU01094843.1.p1  ORF type:complete len:129 (+),score=5.09 GHVU01094843.1:282-668(+)
MIALALFPIVIHQEDVGGDGGLSEARAFMQSDAPFLCTLVGPVSTMEGITGQRPNIHGKPMSLILSALKEAVTARARGRHDAFPSFRLLRPSKALESTSIHLLSLMQGSDTNKIRRWLLHGPHINPSH